MTHILHRQIGHSYPLASHAEGVIIRDSAGKEYIDASSGAAVSCLGHSHPDVLAAMREQLDKLAYAHTSFFTTEVAEQLGDELTSSSAENASASTSLHAGKAITALRSVRSLSAAGSGNAGPSPRC